MITPRLSSNSKIVWEPGLARQVAFGDHGLDVDAYAGQGDEALREAYSVEVDPRGRHGEVFGMNVSKHSGYFWELSCQRVSTFFTVSISDKKPATTFDSWDA